MLPPFKPTYRGRLCGKREGDFEHPVSELCGDATSWDRAFPHVRVSGGRSQELLGALDVSLWEPPTCAESHLPHGGWGFPRG